MLGRGIILSKTGDGGLLGDERAPRDDRKAKTPPSAR